MARGTVICFRTSEALRGVLEKVSQAERRSLSATIENILFAYVQERQARGVRAERRRYPRKQISAPALAKGPDGVLHAGMVHDLALGGVRLSLPPDFRCDLRDDFRMSLVFTLPESTRPLAMQCIPRHLRAGDQTTIGASFVDTDFPSYQILQNQLVK